MRLIVALLCLFGLCPNVMALSGQSAKCSVDGMSLTLDVPLSEADFVYQAPCNPVQLGNPDVVCLSESEFEAVLAIPSQYRKCIDNEPDGTWDSIVEWTQAEKDAQDAADQTASTLQTRTTAETNVDSFDPQNVVLRATLLTILDQINSIRADIQAITEADNQIPDVSRPAFTAAQMKTAIKGKINAGDAD